MCGEESSEPPAKGKLEPFDLGKPGSFGEKKALSHRLRKYSAPPGMGETPGRLAKRKA
jgi:hypothetical protein